MVNSAFIADNTTLHFARVHPGGERISTVDLHSVSKDLGVEISGQIGFSAMEGMKLTIDYRDGLGAVRKQIGFAYSYSCACFLCCAMQSVVAMQN